MAEGFRPIESSTGLKIEEVQPGNGKKLWLFRLPRHVTTQSLEGATIKLPRKNKEGKILGRLDSYKRNATDSSAGETASKFLFRSADPLESTGFRALLSGSNGEGEDESLSVANAFVGQVNVTVASPPLPEMKEKDEPLPRLIEPYRGRPQLKGMRVRAKLAGAGTGYSTSVRRRGEDDGNRWKGSASDGTTDSEVKMAKNKPKDLVSSKQNNKEKRRASSGATSTVEGQQHKNNPSTTVKAKKAKMNWLSL